MNQNAINTNNNPNNNINRRVYVPSTKILRYTMKSVFLGSSGSGKSSIVLQYIRKIFDSQTSSTIGASFNSKFIEGLDYTDKLEIWDTAGQERFNSLIPLYYRSADIAFIVFDLTNKDTFVKANEWVMKIKRENNNMTHIFLVGNKCDLIGSDKDRFITLSEIKKYIEEKEIYYVETSAKSGQNIEKLFVIAYNEIVKTKIEQQSREIKKEIKNNINDNIVLNNEQAEGIGGITTIFSSCFSATYNLFKPTTYIRYTKFSTHPVSTNNYNNSDYVDNNINNTNTNNNIIDTNSDNSNNPD